MKLKSREKAVEFRKQGLSYSEILKQIPVAKSTLSLWLRGVGLSKKQKQKLTEKKLMAAKRGAKKMHYLKIQRCQEIKNRAFKEINKLSKKERWLLGIVLYWAEGSKEKKYGSATNIKFSNSDASMILIFKKWLKEFFQIQEEKMRYEIYIHEKADWISARNFWASKLNIPTDNIKVYFKKHNPKPKRKNIGKEYVGLMRLNVNGTIGTVRMIAGWVDGICKKWGVV